MNKVFDFGKGNVPVLITVPHGGALVPQNIPNRDFGSYKKDRETILTLKEILKEYDLTNKKPYFVCMNLHRRKIDVNRGSREGAQNAEMLKVYKDYHNKIREFRLEIQKNTEKGY
jgi:N-formylglutamate amidohydrolase